MYENDKNFCKISTPMNRGQIEHYKDSQTFTNKNTMDSKTERKNRDPKKYYQRHLDYYKEL